MRVPCVILVRQSKCVSAIKRILCYYLHVYILVFFNVFVCTLLLRCML